MKNQKQFSKINREIEFLLTFLGESSHKDKPFTQNKNGVIYKKAYQRELIRSF